MSPAFNMASSAPPEQQGSKKKCYCCGRTFTLIAEFLKIERSHCKLCDHHVCEFCIRPNQTTLCRKCDILQSTKGDFIRLEQFSDSRINKILYALNVNVKVSQIIGREMCIHLIRLYLDSTLKMGKATTERMQGSEVATSAMQETVQSQRQQDTSIKKDSQVVITKTVEVRASSTKQINVSSKSSIQREASYEEGSDNVAIVNVTDLKKRFEKPAAVQKATHKAISETNSNDDGKTISITREEVNSGWSKHSFEKETKTRRFVVSEKISSTDRNEMVSPVRSGKEEFFETWKKIKKEDSVYNNESEDIDDAINRQRTANSFKAEVQAQISNDDTSRQNENEITIDEQQVVRRRQKSKTDETSNVERIVRWSMSDVKTEIDVTQLEKLSLSKEILNGAMQESADDIVQSNETTDSDSQSLMLSNTEEMTYGKAINTEVSALNQQVSQELLNENETVEDNIDDDAGEKSLDSRSSSNSTDNESREKTCETYEFPITDDITLKHVTDEILTENTSVDEIDLKAEVLETILQHSLEEVKEDNSGVIQDSVFKKEITETQQNRSQSNVEDENGNKKDSQDNNTVIEDGIVKESIVTESITSTKNRESEIIITTTEHEEIIHTHMLTDDITEVTAKTMILSEMQSEELHSETQQHSSSFIGEDENGNKVINEDSVQAEAVEVISATESDNTVSSDNILPELQTVTECSMESKNLPGDLSDNGKEENETVEKHDTVLLESETISQNSIEDLLTEMNTISYNGSEADKADGVDLLLDIKIEDNTDENKKLDDVEKTETSLKEDEKVITEHSENKTDATVEYEDVTSNVTINTEEIISTSTIEDNVEKTENIFLGSEIITQHSTESDELVSNEHSKEHIINNVDLMIDMKTEDNTDETEKEITVTITETSLKVDQNAVVSQSEDQTENSANDHDDGDGKKTNNNDEITVEESKADLLMDITFEENVVASLKTEPVDLLETTSQGGESVTLQQSDNTNNNNDLIDITSEDNVAISLKTEQAELLEINSQRDESITTQEPEKLEKLVNNDGDVTPTKNDTTLIDFDIKEMTDKNEELTSLDHVSSEINLQSTEPLPSDRKLDDDNSTNADDNPAKFMDGEIPDKLISNDGQDNKDGPHETLPLVNEDISVNESFEKVLVDIKPEASNEVHQHDLLMNEEPYTREADENQPLSTIMESPENTELLLNKVKGTENDKAVMGTNEVGNQLNENLSLLSESKMDVIENPISSTEEIIQFTESLTSTQTTTTTDEAHVEKNILDATRNSISSSDNESVTDERSHEEILQSLHTYIKNFKDNITDETGTEVSQTVTSNLIDFSDSQEVTKTQSYTNSSSGNAKPEIHIQTPVSEIMVQSYVGTGAYTSSSEDDEDTVNVKHIIETKSAQRTIQEEHHREMHSESSSEEEEVIVTQHVSKPLDVQSQVVVKKEAMPASDDEGSSDGSNFYSASEGEVSDGESDMKKQGNHSTDTSSNEEEAVGKIWDPSKALPRPVVIQKKATERKHVRFSSDLKSLESLQSTSWDRDYKGRFVRQYEENTSLPSLSRSGSRSSTSASQSSFKKLTTSSFIKTNVTKTSTTSSSTSLSSRHFSQKKVQEG